MEEYEEPYAYSGPVEVVGQKVTLRQLNNKAIEKLHQLIASLDAKSEPERIQACVESLAKLDSALKNSDILEKEISDEERLMQNRSALVGDLLKKGR